MHTLTQSGERWMDGWMDVGLGRRPTHFFFFFFLLEVDRVDTLRRQHKRVWQVVRHNEITFPSVSYKTTTPFFFSIFFPNNSASLHVWNNPPPIWLFALPIQPIILKGSCRKKMKNIFFHDGENTISCRLFNHNKKIWKQMKGGDQKTDPETHRYINQIDCCRRRANQSSCVIFPPRHSLFSFILIHENS
jgi:hypothetical protein